MKAGSRCVHTLLVVLLLGGVVLGSSVSAGDVETRGGVRTDVKTAHAAGMRAYFDPQTGKIGPPPPDQAAAAAAEQSAHSTSGQGLSLVPAPGGGQMIDLQGRFQNTITATLKPDGTVQTECHPSADASAGAVGR